MPTTESFWEYVVRITAYGQNRDIASLVGVDPSAISRWKAGDQPRFQSVVAFARAYQRPTIEALIAAGYLEITDAFASVDIRRSLSDVSDDELWREVHRRWDAKGKQTPDL